MPWIHLDFRDGYPVAELTDDDGVPFANAQEIRFDRELHDANFGYEIRHIPGSTLMTMTFLVTDEERCRQSVRIPGS